MAAGTTLYYFTGTGNSLKVARDIAQELGDAELVSIAQVSGGPVRPTAERVGIVFPTYFGGLPLIVRRFVERLGAPGYVFAVTTCGGFSGGSLRQAAQLLSARGISLAAGFAVNMPGNYTRLYGANSQRKQRKYFAAEAARLGQIADTVRGRWRAKIEASFCLARWAFAPLYHLYFARRAPKQDALFHADEKCNGCGICARVCPMADIELVDRRPCWLGHCEQCYACLQWCPQEAIQANKRTPHRKRYRNPDVRLADIIRANEQPAPPA
jgi:Pyruvate/2-oxoacid:ferredoxin oxidoreductase delta subunit/flavodoxin